MRCTFAPRRTPARVSRPARRVRRHRATARAPGRPRLGGDDSPPPRHPLARRAA
jgi:hypothetical protein